MSDTHTTDPSGWSLLLVAIAIAAVVLLILGVAFGFGYLIDARNAPEGFGANEPNVGSVTTT